MTLAAVGIICERYREQGVELHQYNIGTGKVYDCDLNGKSVEGSLPGLTGEQNIILHGGCVVDAPQRECGTRGWDFDAEFLEDLEQMWQIFRKNTTLWNRQITMIGDMDRFNEETDPDGGAGALPVPAEGPHGSAKGL